jgi:hypothetical protein
MSRCALTAGIAHLHNGLNKEIGLNHGRQYRPTILYNTLLRDWGVIRRIEPGRYALHVPARRSP